MRAHRGGMPCAPRMSNPWRPDGESAAPALPAGGQPRPVTSAGRLAYTRDVSDDSRPVLVYDGRCRFCTREAARLARWAGGRVRLASFREPGVLARYPGLTPEA